MPLAILYNLREKLGTKNKDWQNYSNTFTKIPLPGEPPLVVPREQIIGKDSLKQRYTYTCTPFFEHRSTRKPRVIMYVIFSLPEVQYVLHVSRLKCAWNCVEMHSRYSSTWWSVPIWLVLTGCKKQIAEEIEPTTSGRRRRHVIQYAMPVHS